MSFQFKVNLAVLVFAVVAVKVVAAPTIRTTIQYSIVQYTTVQSVLQDSIQQVCTCSSSPQYTLGVVYRAVHNSILYLFSDIFWLLLWQ